MVSALALMSHAKGTPLRQLHVGSCLSHAQHSNFLPRHSIGADHVSPPPVCRPRRSPSINTLQLSSMTSSTITQQLRSAMRVGLTLALALAVTAGPAIADADMATTCSTIASNALPMFAETNPDFFTTAGCESAGAFQVCDIRGTPGLCSNNPDCPDNQVANLSCSEESEESACCFEEFVQPCDGCDLIPTRCASVCTTGMAVPSTTDPRDGACADFSDVIFQVLVDSDPEFGEAEGCSAADAGEICDFRGVEGPCSDVAECDGFDIGIANCDDNSEDTSCCSVIRSPPCDGCDPEPVGCVTECGVLNPPGSGDDDTPPAISAPAPTTGGECMARADAALAELVDPDSSGEGCDGTDPTAVCAARGTVGRCESNPACPANQILDNACTASDEDVSCCGEFLVQPCENCTQIPIFCITACGRPLAPAPESAEEALDRVCADIADIDLVRLADASPDVFTSGGCDEAEAGVVCDSVGVGGLCSEAVMCEGVEISVSDTCEGESQEEGCCDVLMSKPCADCDVEPALCFQSCFSSSAAPPMAASMMEASS